MNKVELRYLDVIRRHVDGPIRTVVGSDNFVGHMPGAINTILARLMAAGELQVEHLSRIRDTICGCMPLVEAHAARSDRAAALLSRLQEVVSGDLSDVREKEATVTELSLWLASLEDDEGRALYRQLISSEAERLDALEEAYRRITNTLFNGETISGGAAGLDKAQQARLVGEMQTRLGESVELEIVNCKAILGGLCKQTVLVNLRNNRVLPDSVVIRADHPEAPQDTSVVSEYPILELLWRSGVKVPRPLMVDALGAVTGHALMVVSRESGQTIGDGLTFFALPEKGLMAQLAREMARLHAIPVDALPPELQGRGQDNLARMEADLLNLRRVWDEFDGESVIVEAAFRWLFDHLHFVGEECVLTHGDFRFNNILVEDGNIECVLDWETAAVGNPGFDLGYAYHHVVQAMPWGEFLDAYKAEGGIVPSQETLKFYVLRSDLFALVYLAKLEAGFQKGTIEKIDLAYAACHMRQQTLYLLAGRLQRILDDKPL